MKLRVATTSLAGCFGCHMSLLDIDERLFDLSSSSSSTARRSPTSSIAAPATSALIEGGVCNAENVHVLRELRANCKIPGRASAPAPSTAACRRSAIISTSATLLKKVYGERRTARRSVPNDPELPLLLDKVHPLNEVVRVDYFIPGCPPSADAIWKFLTDLIAGPHTAPRAIELLRYD